MRLWNVWTCILRSLQIRLRLDWLPIQPVRETIEPLEHLGESVDHLGWHVWGRYRRAIGSCAELGQSRLGDAHSSNAQHHSIHQRFHECSSFSPVTVFPLPSPHNTTTAIVTANLVPAPIFILPADRPSAPPGFRRLLYLVAA